MSRTILILIVLTFAGITSGQECPEAVAGRLTAAGISAEDIQRFCPAAEALIGRTIVIEAGGELLDDFIRLFLPFGAETALNDARYCRATGLHSVELLAVGTSDGTVASNTLLTANQCTKVASCDGTAPCEALASIAEQMRPEAPDGWAVAARMKLEWSPWRLTLSAIDAESSGIPAEEWPVKRAALLDPASAQIIETTAAALPTPAGSIPSIPSSTAFYFNDASFAMVIAPTLTVAGLSNATPLPPLRAIAGDNAVSADANASLVIAHDAVNRFAADFLSQTPLPIQTDHRPPGEIAIEVLGPALLTAASVTGSRSAYEITGDLRQDDGSFVAKIRLEHDGADDLSVKDVTFRAIRSSCRGNFFDHITCEAGNEVRALRAFIAQTAGKLVLEGKPWIAYLEKTEMELPWGPDTVGLRGTILRIRSDDEALILSANLRLRRRRF